MTLRIAHYYPRAGVGDGGCTAAVRGWAAAVAAAGAQVTVIADGAGDRPTDSAVRWVSVPHRAWGRLRAPVGLEGELQGSDLLVLHSGWVYHNLRAATVATRAGVPYPVRVS